MILASPAIATLASLTQTAATAALPLLLLAVLVSMFRLVRGPYAADRVLTLDLMSILAVGIAAVHAIMQEQVVYLDVMVVVVLVTFLATVGFSRYLIGRERRREHGRERERRKGGA